MQAIELETDILPDGNIRLPEIYRAWYGRHAKIIVLSPDTASESVVPFRPDQGRLNSQEVVNMIRQNRDAEDI